MTVVVESVRIYEVGNIKAERRRYGKTKNSFRGRTLGGRNAESREDDLERCAVRLMTAKPTD